MVGRAALLLLLEALALFQFSLASPPPPSPGGHGCTVSPLGNGRDDTDQVSYRHLFKNSFLLTVALTFRSLMSLRDVELMDVSFSRKDNSTLLGTRLRFPFDCIALPG